MTTLVSFIIYGDQINGSLQWQCNWWLLHVVESLTIMIYDIFCEGIYVWCPPSVHDQHEMDGQQGWSAPTNNHEAWCAWSGQGMEVTYLVVMTCATGEWNADVGSCCTMIMHVLLTQWWMLTACPMVTTTASMASWRRCYARMLHCTSSSIRTGRTMRSLRRRRSLSIQVWKTWRLWVSIMKERLFYSSLEWQVDTKSKVYQECLPELEGIQQLKSALNIYNSCSVDIDKFQAYLKAHFAVQQELYCCYYGNLLFCIHQLVDIPKQRAFRKETCQQDQENIWVLGSNRTTVVVHLLSYYLSFPFVWICAVPRNGSCQSI